MSNSLGFEEFKAKAIEKLEAGVPLSGKDGVLVPLFGDFGAKAPRKPMIISE